MARYSYQGITTNQEGAVIFSATVSVYLTGTTTPASIYAASSGGVAVNSVLSSATTGAFKFYVDSADYALTQRFDITATKTVSPVASYIPVTLEDVSIYWGNPPEIFDVRTLAGDYAPNITANYRNILILTTGGADRNVDPVVVAGSTYEVAIYNDGTETIVFDSIGIAEAVGSGAQRNFFYDGTEWA